MNSYKNLKYSAQNKDKYIESEHDSCKEAIIEKEYHSLYP